MIPRARTARARPARPTLVRRWVAVALEDEIAVPGRPGPGPLAEHHVLDPERCAKLLERAVASGSFSVDAGSSGVSGFTA